MKRIGFVLYLIFLSLWGYSQSYNGKITEVVDGDTYFFKTATGSVKVRMFGIDAPEGNQPFGKESAEFLARFLHKEALLKVVSTDQYHRKLGTLFINGEDINLLLVKEGYAWYYNKYLSNKEYAAAQENARKNKLGLWKDPKPVPPWKWRKDERANGTFHHR